MNLFESKLIAIVCLGVGTILVGFLPACFAHHGRQQWPMFLSSLLCFGAGVLLSTSLVHILPELREALNDYGQYAELIFCTGFFLLYIIDEIVHFFYGDMHETIPVTQQSHEHHRLRRNSALCSTKRYGAMDSEQLYGERQFPYNPAFYRTKSDSGLFYEEVPSQLCHVGHQEPCHTTPTASIGLLVALSVHALLEGLVVGLEGSPSKVLLLLGAIATHKLVVGFCLGMEIASSPANSFCRHFVYIFVFTVGSIAGILVGMVISNIPSPVTDIAIPVLQGLAGGTLLYVTVSEVLPRERARWHQQHNQRAAGLYQFLSVVIGFILMTGLSKYLDYDK